VATIIDLNGSTQPDTHATCDICVIGAGAAGLYLASRLSRHGLRVIILEAGGATCGSGASIGIEPIFSATHYRGALDGRAFGWGGSTSRWGGVLVPHSDLDVGDETSPDFVAWRHITNVVRERSSLVFATLGLRSRPDFLSFPEVALGSNAKLLHDCGLQAVATEFLPFRRRNLTYLASPRMSRNVTVYLNAVASKWLVKPSTNGSGAVTTVEATSQEAKSLRVSAKSFVVAAGAIESARILLEIDRSSGERMFCRRARIGCCLSDHLSCAIADVHLDDQTQVAKLFGPIFSKGRLRSFRFIGTFMKPLLPRHFAHFIFEIENSGFRLVKDLLSSLQRRALTDLRVMDVIDGINGLSWLAYNRVINSRLFIPPRTPAHLQMDVEQTPDSANRVRLGEKTDRFGRPIAIIHWNVTDIDYKNIQMLSQRLLSRWPDHSRGFPRLVPLHIEDAEPKPYDAYHPVGTCRMGSDKEAVVDFELRVRGTQNLYVLSTGVFPSAGTANPTFSMLCLGDMLADKLAKDHADSNSVGLVQRLTEI
jgi:choline dehydrogenase-like flavoprotein